MTIRRSLAALALLMLAFGGRAGAVSVPPVLANDGALYRVAAGRFADLFPGDGSVAADNIVLALDILRDGQPTQRLLVPGTEGPEVESSPILLQESGSDNVHVVWDVDVQANLSYSRLLLRTHSSAGWADSIELAGNSLDTKTGLALAITEDGYRTTIDGADASIQRKILHLVWTESTSAGARSFYTPIVFLNGVYAGWNPVVALDDLVANDPLGGLAMPDALRWTPSIQPGTDGRRVIVSFVDSRSLRLGVVEIESAPGELAQLADMARGHIVELGALYFPNDLPTLATLARGHIVELAGRFHPAVAGYLADQTAALITGTDPATTDLPTLAEMARGHIVELATGIQHDGLIDTSAVVPMRLDIAPLVEPPGTDFRQILFLRRVGSWAAPDVAAGQAGVLASPDGSRVLFGWVVDTSLVYYDSAGDGAWGPRLQLDLSLVALDEALQALERHALGQ